MINITEVFETNKMIEQENLDVRTITMGINLLDCADKDLNVTCEKIYNKITTLASDLVKTGEEISKEFGIPIVNKRISITPIALVGNSCCRIPGDYVKIAKTLDEAAKKVGVNFLGGYSAIVSKGMTKSDELLIRSIPMAMACTERICSSINVGSTKTGINMDAVRLMGDIIKQTAEQTKDNDSLGCAKLVVLCNAPDDNPFMAGAFHGVSEADAIINVGVSGPGVVKYALEQMDLSANKATANDEHVRDANFEVLCETIKKTAFKITRVGQLVAQEASKRLGVPFGIIDLSLAPTPAVGDSVADILKCIGVEHPGAPGTTAALALLNDQVKKGGVMASSYVGGLSGAFIPVSEDQGMIDAVEAGALTIEKLEAMTCVCSVGLDMIAIPGDTPATTISGIIADESAIGMINQKTTAVRIIPVIGKGVGETVEFGGLLGYAPIMPVNTFSSQRFVDRGGRIPAPIHSFKN
ncbi:MAG: PFL family protein [Bacteroidaceae bacterium]|nr:PFL family protein [Bacteroidaceae bacterium]